MAPQRRAGFTESFFLTNSPEMRDLRKRLIAYQRPDARRSLVEILVTAVPLAALWSIAGWASASGATWLALLFTLPAAGFLVRLFAIQHDCGHRSLFASAPLNDWIGRAIGVLTLTPFDCWRQEHAVHHATSGNLDRRGVGSLLTLTVEEYCTLKPLQRLGYRLYRHPVILFVVGPFFVFFVQQRLPIGLMRQGWRPWVSALATNLVLAIAMALAIWAGVWRETLLIFFPTMMIAASIGVWLFYVQHQYEDGHWTREREWSQAEAALHGSSHYHLPQPLRWLSANIGVHHVHHIASRIPFYRLPDVLRDTPALIKVGRLTVRQSLACVGLVLWDEETSKLVSFRTAGLGLQLVPGKHSGGTSTAA